MDLAAKLEVIERLSCLRDEGALTEDEFVDAKSNILSDRQASAVSAFDGEEDGTREHVYQLGRASKWALGGALLTAIIVTAYFVLKPHTGETEKSPLVANPTGTELSVDADRLGQVRGAAASAKVAANEAANAAAKEGKTEALGGDSPADNPPASLSSQASQTRQTTSRNDYVETTDRQKYDSADTTQAGKFGAIRSGSTPAVPIGSPANWLTMSDYPTSALREERSGTTSFRVRIGSDGRVTDCTIIGSSGSPDLDETTCSIVTRRARFTPATDAKGNPTPGSYSNRIRWTNPTD